NLIERMTERIERQLHFVKGRVYIRFQDMFQEHFNPTTITENGRQAQTQLTSNRNRLIDYVGYELLQEVRAVSIRLEAFINQLFKDYYEQISQELLSIDDMLTLPNFEEKRFDTPDYIQAFETINMAIFQDALNVFKNLRSFFEQNERERMKDKFYETLEPEIHRYLEEQRGLMEQVYYEQSTTIFTQITEQVHQEVTMIMSQQINVLNTNIDYKTYIKKLDQISLIVDNLKRKE